MENPINTQPVKEAEKPLVLVWNEVFQYMLDKYGDLYAEKKKAESKYTFPIFTN